MRLEPRAVVEILARLRGLGANEATAWCTYNKGTKTVECTAAVNQGAGRGVFSSMAGALSSERLEILSADVDVLADDLLLTSYTVVDTVATKTSGEDRMGQLSEKLLAAVQSQEPPKFVRVWGQEQAAATKKLSALPSEVRIDNGLSATFTIIEVFTFDRPGLLYALARKLHDLSLVIRHAKIGTYLDQVVDVFYVTSREGAKIHDEGWLEHIKNEMHQAIEPE
jgi:[protein-PII] uridylyltransferase